MSCRSSLSRNEGADNMPDDALAPPLVPVTWTLSRQNHAETRGVCQTGKECVASLVTSVTFFTVFGKARARAPAAWEKAVQPAGRKRVL